MDLENQGHLGGIPAHSDWRVFIFDMLQYLTIETIIYLTNKVVLVDKASCHLKSICASAKTDTVCGPII